jgi:hypothetical protein
MLTIPLDPGGGRYFVVALLVDLERGGAGGLRACSGDKVRKLVAAVNGNKLLCGPRTGGARWGLPAVQYRPPLGQELRNVKMEL